MADPITQPVNTLPTDASPQADDTILTVKTTDGSLVRVALSDIKSLFSVPAASSATPANLGTASAGSSGDFARADHVHNKPTYSKSDVGLGNVDNVQQYSASNPPPYPVSSVNGQTGAVVLTASDVGAKPSSYSAPVDSVNGKTGVVVLGASDVGALPDDTTIPTKTSQLQNDSGFLTSAPVTSVNGQTGAVSLDAEDIGALPDDTPIPTKTSDLTNDSGYITGMEILSYGSSTWNDFITAYQAKKIVYCRASSNSNPASGSQTRLAFMAYVSDASNPTSVEFQYYRSVSSHSATQQGDQVYVYKLESNGTWSVTVREAYTKIVAGTGLSSSYSSGTLTLTNTGGGSVTEVTISTSGAVSQALDAGTIYHFTGALTALTVTATDPTVGTYQFDFISGSTVPTLTVPASWVMPDNFLVEPSARYSLTVENGYCSLKKWSDSHSPFIYLDDDYGDFVINSDALTSSPNAYANVGTELCSFNFSGRLKSQLSANSSLKLCDISAKAKALMGSTYVSGILSVGNGKVVSCIFNTWETNSQVSIKNDTGAALAANTLVSGTIFILRTL